MKGQIFNGNVPLLLIHHPWICNVKCPYWLPMYVALYIMIMLFLRYLLYLMTLQPKNCQAIQFCNSPCFNLLYSVTNIKGKRKINCTPNLLQKTIIKLLYIECFNLNDQRQDTFSLFCIQLNILCLKYPQAYIFLFSMNFFLLLILFYFCK